LSLVEGADPSTSRYQGRADGDDLYLVRGTGSIRFCLVYTDGTRAHSGSACGGEGPLGTTLPNGAEFMVELDGFSDPPAEGETDVSPWVRQTTPARNATS
jgi:hypothetical protein